MNEQSEQRRRVRNSTIGFVLVALTFYFGCIAMFVFRSTHH